VFEGLKGYRFSSGRLFLLITRLNLTLFISLLLHLPRLLIPLHSDSRHQPGQFFLLLLQPLLLDLQIRRVEALIRGLSIFLDLLVRVELGLDDRIGVDDLLDFGGYVNVRLLF
jgi:hypothetical protein